MLKEYPETRLQNLRIAFIEGAKANTSTSKGEDEQPSWAPLRDNYMLTNSRIKDWDKNMPMIWKTFLKKAVPMKIKVLKLEKAALRCF
ncbi:ABC transporter F family member 4-like protein [Trifolium pratense]|uniref:ABC transporter F family member 4-like protein n=1 Tax=Trifolium pratense TaxID=57577 RepID=A0A2K3PEG1_TRIPR|nr:ABC transporter F family member 4-like protein [Trifolium pratense]